MTYYSGALTHLLLMSCKFIKQVFHLCMINPVSLHVAVAISIDIILKIISMHVRYLSGIGKTYTMLCIVSRELYVKSCQYNLDLSLCFQYASVHLYM